ncbi:MAG: N-acetylmuramoyl-L-alanine amidase-like domain-containing protein [Actinomycetota bacterium]
MPVLRFALYCTLAGALSLGAVSAAQTLPPPSAVAPSRLDTLTRAYLGTPYRLDCLGEACLPDRDPLYTRKYADCQTLVEQVMAEALAPHLGGLDSAGRLIRYSGSLVRIENRHHYCIPDWLENPWPARDVTREVGGGELKPLKRRLDRPTLLKQRGANPKLSPTPAEVVTTSYIPRARVRAALSRIPDGSIAVFVSSNPAVVAGHVGFLFRKGKSVTLRHASQRQKKVIDQPLLGFLEKAPRTFIGLKVLQPDVNGLRRRSKG